MNLELKPEHLKLMNKDQKKVVKTQWRRHRHEDFYFDYDVSGDGDTLKHFLIKKGVWNPLIASARYHARYFFYHTALFLNKTVIEIGAGTGLMGVVMAKYGAKKVLLSDITSESVENILQNVKQFKLETNTQVVKSDLFENIHDRADLIVWMMPFFPGYPPADSISASMIMPPELFRNFLVEAKKHLKSGGVIVLPSFSLGGKLNDPRIVAKKLGYVVKTTWQHNSTTSLQRGLIYMHELRLK